MELMNRSNFPVTRAILFDSLHKYGEPGRAILKGVRSVPPVEIQKYSGQEEINGVRTYASDYELNADSTALSSSGHAEYMADRVIRAAQRQQWSDKNDLLMSAMLVYLSEESKTDLKTKNHKENGYLASIAKTDTFRLYELIEETHLFTSGRGRLLRLKDYLSTVQNGSHEEYLNVIRERLALFISDFESEEHPGFISIDDLSQTIYVNGCDQQFFERKIEDYLVSASTTCAQVQDEFHMFYKSKGGALASQTPSLKSNGGMNASQALAVPALPIVLLKNGRVSLGPYNSTTNADKCSYCWGQGYDSYHKVVVCRYKDRGKLKSALIAQKSDVPLPAIPIPVIDDDARIIEAFEKTFSNYQEAKARKSSRALVLFSHCGSANISSAGYEALVSLHHSDAWYYDNAASYSIVRALSSLLDAKVLDIPIRVGGVRDGILLTHCGKLDRFGVAYYSLEASCNLVSLSILQRDGYSYATIGTTQLLLRDPSGTILDQPTMSSNNLYPVSMELIPLSSLVTEPKIVTISSLSAYPAVVHFNAEQRDRCERAEALHQGEGVHSSDDVLIESLSYGAFPTYNVSPADIRLNRKLRGPCPQCLEAKFKHKPMPPSETPPATAVAECLCIDISDLKVKSVGNRNVGVRMVDEFSGDVLEGTSKSKAPADLVETISDMICLRYVAHGHVPKKIVSDSEAAVKASAVSIGSLKIAISFIDPGQKGQRIERHISTLNSLRRAVLASLDYWLPEKYMPYCKRWVADCRNGLVTSRSCPLVSDVIVTGARRVPHYKYKNIKFGMVCMVAMDNPKRDTIAAQNHQHRENIAKTEIGVCLGYAFLTPGDYDFLLANGMIVARRVIKPVQVHPFDWPRKNVIKAELRNPVEELDSLTAVDANPIMSQAQSSSQPMNPSIDLVPPRSRHLVQVSDGSIVWSSDAQPNVVVPPSTRRLIQLPDGSIIWSDDVVKLSEQQAKLLPSTTLSSSIIQPDEMPVVVSSNPNNALPVLSVGQIENLSVTQHGADAASLVDKAISSTEVISPITSNSNSPEAAQLPIPMRQGRSATHGRALPPGTWSGANVACAQYDTRDDEDRFDEEGWIYPKKSGLTFAQSKQAYAALTPTNILQQCLRTNEADDVANIPVLAATSFRHVAVSTSSQSDALTACERLFLSEAIKTNELNAALVHQALVVAADTAILAQKHTQWFDTTQFDEISLEDSIEKNNQLGVMLARVASSELLPIYVSKCKEISLYTASKTLSQSKLALACDVEILKQQALGCLGNIIFDSNDLPQSSLVVGAHVLFKEKDDGRFTCRVAGRGDTLPIDMGQVNFASVSPEGDKMFCLAAMQAHCEIRSEKLNISDIDVVGAFLRIKRPVDFPRLFLRFPKNFPHILAGKLLEVFGALYGLVESNRLFDIELSRVIVDDAGFTHDTVNSPRTFIKVSASDSNKKCIVNTHVDDIRTLDNCPDLRSDLFVALKARFGDLHENLESTTFTGIELVRFPNGAVAQVQDRYIDRVATSIGVKHLPPVDIPCHPDFFNLSASIDDCVAVDIKLYQSLTGTLVQMKTRDDVKHLVSHLCSKNSCPTEGDYSKAIHLLRYLYSSPGVGRVFKSNSLAITLWADASFANLDTGRSTGSYFLSVGRNNAPFDTVAKAIGNIATTPMDAEYMNASNACKRLMHFRYLSAFCGWPQGPTILCLDSQTAINLALAPQVSKKSLHIDVKYHYIRECADAGYVRLEFVPAEYQRADIITKYLPRIQFIAKRTVLLNLNSR